MSGRAQWLADRQDLFAKQPSSPPPQIAKPPAPTTMHSPALPQRGRERGEASRGRCKEHGNLLSVDSFGRKFRKPICLECLPPHHAGCLQGLYMEKQAIFLGFQRDQDPDYDLTEEEFWERFGLVPQCQCSARLKALEIREDPSRGSFTGKITAWTWRTLRPKLTRYVRHLLGKKAPADWELEQLARAADPIPAESPEARARAVWNRLQEFEPFTNGLT